MKIIIHVSPLTRKMFINRYSKGEPFKIHTRDIMNKRLWYDLPEKFKPTKYYADILSESIEVDVPRNLYRHLKANNRIMIVGMHLHSEIKNDMCMYILGRAMAGHKPKKVLREYLDLMSIQEREFPIDTAYKEWKRFKMDFFEKISKKFAHFWFDIVPQNCARENKVLYSPEMLVKSVSEHFSVDIKFLKCKIEKEKLKNPEISLYVYERQVLFYLLKHYSGLSSIKISKICARHHSVIRRHIKKIEDLIPFYDTIQEDIEAIKASFI